MVSGRVSRVQAQGRRVVVGLVAAGALVTFSLFFAPSQVGGAATYSITEGNSMEPLLHKNALVLVRAQSNYKVGDVVLYQSSVLHRPVLHRILVIQNGHFFFKGDHNDFVDPGYAIRSELVGKLWLHFPALGGVLGWIGKPLHAALIAALTVAFLVLGGVSTGRRRQRRRGPMPGAAPRVSARRYLTRATSTTLLSLSALVLVGLVLAVVGFASPSTRAVQVKDAYQHTGAFSYRARPLTPSAFYPGRVAVTGQPLLASLIDTATFRFKYRFVSKLDHRVHGTIELKALILSKYSTWQNLYTVKTIASFKGDTAATGGRLKLSGLFGLLNQLSTAAGTPGVEYAVDVQPVVHIVGTVGGKRIDATFSPVLPFSVTPLQAKLDVAAPVSLPGATYTPPTQSAALDAMVRPAEPGSIPGRAPNHVTVARYQISIFAIRLLALFAFMLAAIVAIVHDRLLRRHAQRPDEEQIAAHLGCLMTPIDALPLQAGTTPTPVHDFRSLAELARYLERPILRYKIETGSTYAVADETGLYQYHAAPLMQVAPQGSPTVPKRMAHKRSERPTRLTIGGAGLVLVIAITLVTSFTATTTVPTSNVGASSRPRQVSELTPAGCASLPLTVVVSGSGKFTNNVSNALVLGSSGTDTITDRGTKNCVVGGGGQDSVSGDKTGICIIGPNPGTSYKGCSTSA